MAAREENISTERLFESSEAVMQAVRETISDGAPDRKNRAPYPPDLMGSDRQPDCLSQFTRDEVEEGTAFLVRLGYLELPTTK